MIINQKILASHESKVGIRLDTDTPIAELYLDMKAGKALERLNVRTVGDLLSLDLERVVRIRGMGAGTQRRLSELRRSVRASLDRDNADILDSQSGWETIVSQFRIRTRNGLARLKIDSVASFLSLTRDEFLSVRAIGATCWREVKHHQERLRQLMPRQGSSVLRSPESTATAPDGNNDGHLLSAVRGALGRRAYILDELGVESFFHLTTMTYENVTRLRGVGETAWKKLQEAIQTARQGATAREARQNVTSLQATDFPLFTGVKIDDVSIPGSLYPSTRVEELGLTQRVAGALNTLHMSTLGDVLMADPCQFFDLKNFGVTSLEVLRQAVLEYIAFRTAQGSRAPDLGDSFSEFISLLCSYSGQSYANTQVILSRMGVHDGVPKTYDVIALECHVTRSRVGQLIKALLTSISQHFRSSALLKSFAAVIRNILLDCRGVVDLATLCASVSDGLGWKEAPSIQSLKMFLHAFAKPPIKVLDGTVQCVHPCRTCEKVADRARSLLESNPSGILSFEVLSPPNVLCGPSPRDGCSSDSDRMFTHVFLKDLADRAHLRWDGEGIYSPSEWTLAHGSLSRKAVTILQRLARPATPDEVWERVCPYLDTFQPPERIHAALTQADVAYIWGRKEYLHRDHIQIKAPILEMIRHTLNTRLERIPFVAIHGIFYALRDECIAAGIPNEYALSTVVTLYLSEFHMDRYRYVYSETAPETTCIDLIVENWMGSQGGEVKKEHLTNWLVQEVGVRPSVVVLCLSRVREVITSRRGYLIHIDNTGLDSKRMEPFFEFARKSLEQHDHISVRALIKEHQVLCYQLGIASSLMLHAAMRYFAPDDLDLSRYPHILRQDVATFENLGVAISEYVRERFALVSVTECIKHFEEKGYPPVQLKVRVAGREDILPVYAGCVVHQDTIGWNVQKEEVLRATLREAYSARLELGHLTGDIDDVLYQYEDGLPTLPAGLGWTQELIAALATSIDGVILLGNTRRAYACSGYPHVPGTLEELVVMVVRDVFGGGCSREQLDTWLQENGVVRRRLLGNMLQAPDGLDLGEYECVWKGCRDA